MIDQLRLVIAEARLKSTCLELVLDEVAAKSLARRNFLELCSRHGRRLESQRYDDDVTISIGGLPA